MTDLSRHHLPHEPDPNEIAETFGVDPGHERAGEKDRPDDADQLKDHDALEDHASSPTPDEKP